MFIQLFIVLLTFFRSYALLDNVRKNMGNAVQRKLHWLEDQFDHVLVPREKLNWIGELSKPDEGT